MKSWIGYSNRFLKEMLGGMNLSVFEKALIASLALMCLFSAIDTISNHDPGNSEQLKLAKSQAQPELMALRTAEAR